MDDGGEARTLQAQSPALAHTMLRVGDLEASLAFYVGKLGMTLRRFEPYPSGRFTLAFVGYGDGPTAPTIELTHNWDRRDYRKGDGFGHIAIGVADVRATCEALAARAVEIVRPPGPMAAISTTGAAPETIAFIVDPDGYRIELVEHPRRVAELYRKL